MQLLLFSEDKYIHMRSPPFFFRLLLWLTSLNIGLASAKPVPFPCHKYCLCVTGREMANFTLVTHSVLQCSWVFIALALTSTKHNMHGISFRYNRRSYVPGTQRFACTYVFFLRFSFLRMNCFPLPPSLSCFQCFLVYVHNLTHFMYICENNNDVTGSWNAS